MLSSRKLSDSATIFFLICTFVLLKPSFHQPLTVAESLDNPCLNAKTCSACIQGSPACAWCASSNYPIVQSRCDLYEHLKNRCPVGDDVTEEALVYPASSIHKTKGVVGARGDGNEIPTQVQPQSMNIITRTNSPLTFNVSFRQAEDYPVDLYFLLDLSYTMVREKGAQKRLIALGLEMPARMKNITKDFSLGFGTFVDKAVMPYTPWTDQMLEFRCPLRGKSCRKPHDFINQLELSKDSELFKERMTNALSAVSQSFDDSEGGLDGVMQVLACENEIGWREKSRRIIVYSSNSLFHLAGSGLLGGAVKDNDGICRLNSTGSYSPADVKYDFPSVSQISAMLAKKSTSMIFAVMESVYSHYEKLRNMLGNAEIGTLQSGSSNVVDLIQRNYNKLRSKIHFVPKNADGIDFSFKSKCLGNTVQQTAWCDGLEIGDRVDFNVTMTVSSALCEQSGEGLLKRTVELSALGLNENILIDLSIICDCQCERDGFEESSDKCSNGNGTYECGICRCNEGRHGRICECSTSDITSDESLKECRMGNDTLVCSGNGECLCGVCNCFTLGSNTGRKYSGEHCECNDYSCPRSRFDGTLCGGNAQGQCSCSQCQCLTGWSGDACDCSTDDSTCVASNGLMCNGAGECQCGRCRCNVTSDFMGLTCEECKECPTKCSQHRDCVECFAFGSGKYTRDQCLAACTMEMSKELSLELDNPRVVTCNYRDKDDCLFHFTYEYDVNNEIIIKIQEEKDCPLDVSLATVLGPVVAAVVLIPLLLLCVFIFIRNRKDAAEFARFMKEKDRARWDTGANPIYKDPKTIFKNPTYEGVKQG